MSLSLLRIAPLVAILAPTPSSAQTAPAQYTLATVQTSPLPIPGFQFTSVQCDRSGDAYFLLPNQLYEVNGLIRISADGKEGSPIVFPKNLGRTGEWTYSVNADGTVYELYTSSSKQILIHISASGEELGRRALSLPKFFHPHAFAVQSSGPLMILGDEPTDEASPSPAALARLFWVASDNSTRQITIARRYSYEEKQEDAVLVTPNEQFYVISNRHAFVFGVDGSLVRSFALIKPTANSFLMGAQLVQGELVLEYMHSTSPRDIESTAFPVGSEMAQSWLTLSPQTGAALGAYAMPAQFRGTGLCSLGAHQFLYITAKQGVATLLQAQP